MTTTSSEDLTPLDAAAGSRELRDPESWGFAEGEEIVPGLYSLELLGGGFDYEAFLAWNDHLASLVVAKLVRPHLLADERTLRALRREADLIGRLAHPVIVRGFDADLDCPRPHLLMEHLEGPPLSSTVRHFGALGLEQLLPLAFQIASALAYLENEEVVHLDVKPRNVILGVPPRLIDLSIARSFERARQISSSIGTDAYMAPEQCDPSLAEIGPAADVWGLGATLHHAISGNVPFSRAEHYDGSDPRQRWPQLREFPALLPESCPRELEELVLDCLEPEAERRPRAAAVAAALEPLIASIKRGRILGRGRPRIF